MCICARVRMCVCVCSTPPPNTSRLHTTDAQAATQRPGGRQTEDRRARPRSRGMHTRGLTDVRTLCDRFTHTHVAHTSITHAARAEASSAHDRQFNAYRLCTKWKYPVLISGGDRGDRGKSLRHRSAFALSVRHCLKKVLKPSRNQKCYLFRNKQGKKQSNRK